MSKIKWLIILAVLAVVFLSLITAGYLSYNKLENKAKALKNNLADTNQALEAAREELSGVKQKNLLLSAEKEKLEQAVTAAKEEITQTLKTREELQKKQEALTSGKQKLEEALEEAKHSYEEQVSLHKLDAEAREEQFRKKLADKQQEFIAETKSLQERVKSVEAELDEISRQKHKLAEKLERSRQTMVRLRLEKGEEPGREDEEFQKEALKIHYNNALAYDQRGQYEKALAEYKKALEIAPEDADIYYNIAILYDEYLLDKKKAVEHYQVYLKLNPGASDAARVNYWIREARKDIEWQKRIEK